MLDHPDDPLHVAACADCQARAGLEGLDVCGVNAALGLVASVFAAEAAGLTLGWLVPMTTVAALALAAATLARSANVGVVVALAGWCIVVLAAAVGTHDLATAVLQAN